MSIFLAIIFFSLDTSLTMNKIYDTNYTRIEFIAIQ